MKQLPERLLAAHMGWSQMKLVLEPISGTDDVVLSELCTRDRYGVCLMLRIAQASQRTAHYSHTAVISENDWTVYLPCNGVCSFLTFYILSSESGYEDLTAFSPPTHP